MKGKNSDMNELKKEKAYELFRNKMESAVAAYYGEGYEVCVKKVSKLNGVELYGINILEKGKNICPTIYLEQFYEKYAQGKAFSTVFNELIAVYERYKETDSLSVDFFSDYEKVKKKLVVKLINAEYNKELLEDIPHRYFTDLAIVCMVEIDSMEEHSGTVLIHNNHICMWGIRENTLLDDATENSMKISEPRINKMSDVILAMYENCDNPKTKEEIRNDMEWIESEPYNMFVLSNKKQHCGASVIIYPDLLAGIGDSLKCDFYILPSSIHEVIILPKSISGLQCNMNSMIESINKEMLLPEEVLADHAYYYSRSDARLISIA